MTARFISLGLMSGTSMDGIDASVIDSDGIEDFKIIHNEFTPYDKNLIDELSIIRAKINSINEINSFADQLRELEKKITLKHAIIVNNIIKKFKDINIIGFHGQTIYHDGDKKISKQLGDGNLLSQLTKKTVIYNFRQNDIKNGGEGAPLSPVFHNLIVNQKKIELPVCIMNIGGITNVTTIEEYKKNNFSSKDLGPGNCLIDEWIRNNTKNQFDKNGEIASVGKINQLILNQALDNFDNRFNHNTLSFDTKDFDLGFVRGLSLEDGAATLTDFTGSIIGTGLLSFLSGVRYKLWKVLICGGGRKNNTLVERIKNRTPQNLKIQSIDDYGVDGDFVESQAFAYLAIRSFLKLPISFPATTGCKEPVSGGTIVNNF